MPYLVNLITSDTKIKVSSDKSASKKHLIDGSPETCWTSQQDLPQSIQLIFPQPVVPKLLTFTFQGGFVGTQCVIQTTTPSEDSTAKPTWENLTNVYPEDVNRKQVFDLPPMPTPKGISGIKFTPIYRVVLPRIVQLSRHFTSTNPSRMSYPSTIQAITIAKVKQDGYNGDFQVIEKTTQPFKPSPSDIVIKVEYFGVNFIDTYYRKGLYPLKSFPAVLGKEVSGTIVALPTDANILNDPDFQARKYVVGGKVAADWLGSHSDYAAIPYKLVYPVPPSVSTLTAAAGLVQALTAVTFMDESYEVKKGDVLLVHTVAGGLGLLHYLHAGES
ncbi:hypothetical protein ONZ45_g18707 [Pleurotus djamor]|nr:hypothetical protein ONZ45_g18707 [Pleurotus djamor]